MKRIHYIYLTLSIVLLMAASSASARDSRVRLADTPDTIQVMTLQQAAERRARFEKAQKDSAERVKHYADSLLRVKEVKDSLKFAADSIKAIKDSISKNFSALDYSLQKRYRPKNDEFVSMNFMDNTFLSAHVGTNLLIPRNEKNGYLGIGPDFQIAFGKWFNPYNALRIGLNSGYFFRTTDNFKVVPISLSAMHMFNLMSYIGGYRMTRFCEISTVEGLSYNLSVLNKQLGHSLGLHLGFNVDMRLNKNVDFFVEPLFSFYSDNIDLSGDSNWRGFDIGFNASIGVKYNMMHKDRAVVPVRKHKTHLFFSLTEGLQFQNSALVKETMGIGNSLGGHFDFSVGCWFTPYFALNSSVFYSFHKWVMFPDKTKYPSQYAGLRVEAMFDLAYLFKEKENKIFSLPVFVGPEIGYMNKKDMDRSIKQGYFGVTYGLQLDFRIYKALSFYLEPRMSIVPYSVAEEGPTPALSTRTTYYDYVLNFNIGFKYTL